MALPAFALQALLAAGPSLIRGAGKLLGGRTDAVADTVAEMVEGAQAAIDPQTALAQEVRQLPLDQQVELQALAVEVQRIEAEREHARLSWDQANYAETQQSYRAELASVDAEVRRTRPQIARRSFFAGTAYVLLMELARLLPGAGADVGADLMLAGVIYSPCFEYLGMRTLDKIFGKENAGDRSAINALRDGFSAVRGRS